MKLRLKEEGSLRLTLGDIAYRESKTVIPAKDQNHLYIGLDSMSSVSYQIEGFGSDTDIAVPKTPVKIGDILFARRNTYLRRVARCPIDGFYSPDGYVVRTKDDRCKQDFLLWVLATDQFLDYSIKWSAGTHSKRVKWADLEKFELLLPGLEDQEEFVRLMDAITTYELQLKQVLLSLNELRLSYVSNYLNSGAVQTKEFTLGEISVINYGYTEAASKHKIGPKFLRITDIQDDAVDWEEVPFVNISKSDTKKHLLQDGDIVFARTGATTGKSYLLRNPPEAVAASYLIRLRPNRNQVLPEFLSTFFSSSEYWDQVRAGTSGSAQGGVNSTKLSRMKLNIPSMDSQKVLVTKVRKFVSLQEQYREMLSRTHNLRKQIINEVLQFSDVKK
jgi:type I restriction enzyme, S subunit